MRRWLAGSLAARLLSAQALVIVAGSLTLALVALAVAPGLFRDHVREAIGTVPDDVARHLDRAFAGAVLVALGLAVAAAGATALAASWLLSLRLVRPIRALAAAAGEVARGGYGTRVPIEGSDELAALGGAFNEMAAGLEAGERLRREQLADVAHELRTPLATLEGYVEGLADGVVPATAETWTTLRSETRRMRRLVEDLDEVSRAEARQLGLRPRPTEPAALVEAAVRAAAPAFAAKGVALGADAPRTLPPVEVDPDRLAEVLGNLLDNALRHTPPGGRVEVAAGTRGELVELSVADTGEGIAAEHLEHVLDRFYRADPSRSRTGGGSGIGLTIARAIAEAHGGGLRARSEGPGRGARFTVTLPAGARRRSARRDRRAPPAPR